MSTTLELPLPSLSKGCFASLSVLTDEVLYQQCGVRIAFTERLGGVSEGPYGSLNLGDHVDDEASYVQENRRRLFDAFGTAEHQVINPNQVHGKEVLSVRDSAVLAIERYRNEAQQGADGIAVGVPEVGALLCFADCLPLILVSPVGHFAVIHAGWRGAEQEIAKEALAALADLAERPHDPSFAAGCNAYIGPYIGVECFEVSTEIRDQFVARFGQKCAPDERHVDLGVVVSETLMSAGMTAERICEARVCTVCNNENYFSFRKQDGVCGRHGAFALWESDR